MEPLNGLQLAVYPAKPENCHELASVLRCHFSQIPYIPFAFLVKALWISPIECRHLLSRGLEENLAETNCAMSASTYEFDIEIETDMAEKTRPISAY